MSDIIKFIAVERVITNFAIIKILALYEHRNSEFTKRHLKNIFGGFEYANETRRCKTGFPSLYATEEFLGV